MSLQQSKLSEFDTQTKLTDWNKEEELIDSIRSYAEELVEDGEIEVDMDMIVRWETNTSKRKAGQVKSYKLPLTASIGDEIDKSRAKNNLEGVERYGECIICFSRRAFKNHTEEQARSHIRHELIHIEQVQKFGKADHGRYFESRAEELDTSIHCENFVPYKYKIVCKGCGDVVGGRYRSCKTVNEIKRGGVKGRCCGEELKIVE